MKTVHKPIRLLVGSVSFVAVGVFLSTLAFLPTTAKAYQTESLTVDSRNDFVLEPAKQELFLNPGDSVTQDLYVTDRTPGVTTFKIETDDIKGSNDANTPVIVLNSDEKGPYSGKDFISYDSPQFTLSFGQRATIPVTITIPKTASPGGYYSAVLVSNAPAVIAQAASSTISNAIIISRLGTLFFIRVNGQADVTGQLQDFRIGGASKSFYDSGPFTFEVLFNNSGNVHLVPYGVISIKNLLGREVAQVPVDAYYSLPQSLRYRDVTWNQIALFGRYTATLTLNRGYGNITDTKTIAFWVIPWKFLLGAFALIFVLIFCVSLFMRTFEIKRK
jgi:hypothetical protein